MIRSYPRILVEVLKKTHGSSDISALSSTDLNIISSDVDTSADKVCDLILVREPKILLWYFDLTLTGAQRYHIPSSVVFDHEDIHMITDITEGSTIPTATVQTVWSDRMLHYGHELTQQEMTWNLQGEYLEFPYQPSTGTLRVWYTRRPKGYFYGTASSGSTTTAVISTASAGEIILETDYYNGMKLYNGSQVRRITDTSFSGSALTLTTDAFSTAVSSSTTISIISPLPERYQQLIVDEAIRRQKVGRDDDDSLIARLSYEDTNIMQSRLGNRAKQSHEQVKRISW